MKKPINYNIWSAVFIVPAFILVMVYYDWKLWLIFFLYAAYIRANYLGEFSKRNVKGNNQYLVPEYVVYGSKFIREQVPGMDQLNIDPGSMLSADDVQAMWIIVTRWANKNGLNVVYVPSRYSDYYIFTKKTNI